MKTQEKFYVALQYQRYRIHKGKEEIYVKWADFKIKTWEPLENIISATEEQVQTFRDTYKKVLQRYAQMGIKEKQIQIINPQATNYLEQQLKLDQEYKHKWTKASKNTKRTQNKDMEQYKADIRTLRKTKKIEKYPQYNERKIEKKISKQILSPESNDHLLIQKQQYKKNEILPQIVEKFIPRRIKLNFGRENIQQQQKQSIVSKHIRHNDGWIDSQIGEIKEYVSEEQYKAPLELKHLKNLIKQASKIKRRLLMKNKGNCFQLQLNESFFQFPIIVHQKYIEDFKPQLLASFYLEKVRKMI